MNGVLITGAAGFIGSHVTRYFCKKGIRPTCYVKKTTDTTFLPHKKVSICYGDILNIETLTKAMQGIDTVIHIASKVSDWGQKRDFYNINIQGSINVLKTGHKAGVKHFIFTGSISSYGEENNNKVKNESFPFNSHYPYFIDHFFPCKMNNYRDSKAFATQKTIQYATDHNLNVTILEPVWVFGEREFNTGFYQYLKIIKSGIKYFPGHSNNKLPVIYCQDLARAYYLAFSHKLKGVHRFIIGNQNTPLLNSVLNQFCKEINKKPPRKLPLWLIYPLAFIIELLATIFHSDKAPILTRARSKMYYDNVEFSSSKAWEVLSFKNEISIAQGIKRTVRWYKMNHLI